MELCEHVKKGAEVICMTSCGHALCKLCTFTFLDGICLVCFNKQIVTKED